MAGPGVADVEAAGLLALKDLVCGTTAGEKRVLVPARKEVDETGRFFVLRPNYNYARAGFHWVNQPDLASFPRRATVNSTKLPITQFGPFELNFDGQVADLVDFYDSGPVSFVSSKLFAIFLEIAAGEIDAAQCFLTCGAKSFEFYATMPMRAFAAAHIESTAIEIRTRVVTDKILGSFVYPSKYRLNPDIPESVEVFADLAEPKVYWSRRLVEACESVGIRGISMQTTYAATIETVEI